MPLGQVRAARIEQATATAIRVLWTPPGTGAQAVACTYGVKVELQTASKPEQQQQPSKPRIVTPESESDGFACLIDDLESAGTYTFTILATGLLTGERSATVLVHTMPSARPDAPRALSAALMSLAPDPLAKGKVSAAVAFTWNAPAHPNGTIRGYTIHLRQSGASSTEWTDVAVPDASCSHTCTLLPYTLYEYEVSATNEVGTGPRSATGNTIRTGTNARGEVQAREPRTPAPAPPPPAPLWTPPSSTSVERLAVRQHSEHNLQSVQFRALMQMHAKGAGSPLPPVVEPVTSGYRKQVNFDSAAPASSSPAALRRLQSINESPKPLIMSAKGTVRGVRNRVPQQLVSLYERRTAKDVSGKDDVDGPGKVILYITSCRAIRDTYEACQVVSRIFHNLRFRVDTRDVFVISRFNAELSNRLPAGSNAETPQVRGPIVSA